MLLVIDQHAHKVAQMEFGSELERDKALKAVVDKMIQRVSLASQADRAAAFIYDLTRSLSPIPTLIRF